jgi:hypothetical protein
MLDSERSALRRLPPDFEKFLNFGNFGQGKIRMPMLILVMKTKFNVT